MALNKQGTSLTLVRVSIGIFLFFTGLAKMTWFTSSAPLASTVGEWLTTAHPLNRWYLQHAVVPGLEVFARLVPLGEIGLGLALILGLWTRTASAIAFLMVLNFHVASGLVFQYRFLTQGSALPVLGGLLALAIGGVRLPLSVRR